MIADATTIDRSIFDQTFDVCVIGAGPAGITIARTLAATGANVALMEAGGLELTDESQDVYRGTNLGLDYFDMDTARLRYFGGTSNHWAGWTRALDPYDFTPKPYMALSGWPISRLDLDPYRARADEILDVPSETEAPDLPFRQRAYNFRRFQFRWSPPTRFAEKYGPEIEASPNIHLFLNANLVDLHLADGLDTVDGRGLPQLRPRRPRLHRQGPRLRALHRRRRERAAAAQLHQPDPAKASATAPTWSAAASATTRTSCSPTSPSRCC